MFGGPRPDEYVVGPWSNFPNFVQGTRGLNTGLMTVRAPVVSAHKGGFTTNVNLGLPRYSPKISCGCKCIFTRKASTFHTVQWYSLSGPLPPCATEGRVLGGLEDGVKRMSRCVRRVLQAQENPIGESASQVSVQDGESRSTWSAARLAGATTNFVGQRCRSRAGETWENTLDWS